MTIPPYLNPGDHVGIVCTARKFTAADAQPAIELLNSWQLQVILGKTIGLDNHQLGGSDQERADDLQAMINDPKIKAIWCARGGYGTVRIIDKIDFTPLLKNPKWIIGFSDVTVLHSHLHGLDIASLHAIMPFSVPKADQKAIVSLQKALFGESLHYEIPSDINNQAGQAQGVVVGGNLSILYSLLGSESAVNTTDKILYFEDLDEYLYHIDRMLMNLKRNGYFKNVKGIIVGGMTDMHDNQIPYGMDTTQIILDIVDNQQIPICFNFPAGHLPDNRALKLGAPALLDVRSDVTVLKFI